MLGTETGTSFIELNQGVTQFCSSVPAKFRNRSGWAKYVRSFEPPTRCHQRKSELTHRFSFYPPPYQNTQNTGTTPYIYIYNNNIIIKNQDLAPSKNLFQVLYVKFTPSERWNTFIINDLQRLLPPFPSFYPYFRTKTSRTPDLKKLHRTLSYVKYVV